MRWRCRCRRAPIERILGRMPGVVGCAVYGVPDASSGGGFGL